jgi:hypothetical protein
MGLALALAAGALLVAVLPLWRPAATTAPSISCGSPLVAVGRPDRSQSLSAIGRLPSTGAQQQAAASAQDLARLGDLERQVSWYRACHAPAARRMVLANGLALLSVASVVTGLVLFSRGGVSTAPHESVLRSGRTNLKTVGSTR